MSADFRIDNQVALQRYNTFGIKANAEYLLSVYSVAQLQRFLHFYNTNKQFANVPLFVLGGGSNILLTNDVQAFVLRPVIRGKKIIQQDTSNVLVRVGAGETWDKWVQYAVEKGWGGIENLSLIPGNVGASPIQNIGAYGQEVRNVIEKVEAIDIQTGKTITFLNHDCKFGYRDSIFKHDAAKRYVIVYVYFRLNKQPNINTTYGAISDEIKRMYPDVQHIDINHVRQAVISIRQSKLPNPAEIGNAGSFFKNPVVPNALADRLKTLYPTMPLYNNDANTKKLAAGWLIEQCGWRGYRAADAGVHSRQALVLVNYGNASGNDILLLARQIQQSVWQKFEVQLETEVNIW